MKLCQAFWVQSSAPCPSRSIKGGFMPRIGRISRSSQHSSLTTDQLSGHHWSLRVPEPPPLLWPCHRGESLGALRSKRGPGLHLTHPGPTTASRSALNTLSASSGLTTLPLALRTDFLSFFPPGLQQSSKSLFWWHEIGWIRANYPLERRKILQVCV